MNKGSITAKLLIASLGIIFYSISASAQTIPVRPSFPVCTNPQGVVKVEYDSGIHGIPGDTAAYYGSDIVYSLSEVTLTQCLCSTNGEGIQTNWWNVSSLSFEEIETLKKLGWVYVPDGSEWGLVDGSYLALSNGYDCAARGDNDDDDDDDDDDKDKASSKKKRSDGRGGQVLAASTYIGDVLGLASTGNSVELISYGLLAAASVALIAYYMVKQDKN